MAGLTEDDRRQAEQWLAAHDRYTTLIPVEALKARQQRLDQASFDPITLEDPGEEAG